VRWILAGSFVDGLGFSASNESGELVVGGPERVELRSVGFGGTETLSEGAEESVVSVFELAAWWAIGVEAEEDVVEVGTVSQVRILNRLEDDFSVHPYNFSGLILMSCLGCQL